MRASRPINRHQTPEQFIVEQLRATSTYSSDTLFAWACVHDTGSNRVFGFFYWQRPYREKANETIHTLAEVTDYGEGHNGLIRKF